MADEAEVFTDEKDAGKGEAGLVRLWMNEINLARKREEDWRKDAKKTVQRYLNERDQGLSETTSKPVFNILWSNTEVLKPALYFKAPKADVRLRNKDFRDTERSKILKDVSTVLERGLDYALDIYDFDEMMESVVGDYVLPGRGQARVRYVPEIVDDVDEFGNPTEVLRNEKVIGERVHWKDFAHGPGRTWDEVEWVAFLHRPKKREVIETFGEKASDLEFDAKDEDEEEKKQKSIFKRLEVWEVWDKPNRRIIFLTFDKNKRVLSIEPDELNLDDFFPCPRPILSVPDNDSLVPRPEYMQYKDLADELDEVTNRIQKITKAVKVAGVYDAALDTDINTFADIQDNEFKPTQSHATIAQSGGLDKHVHYLPVEQAANVLAGLYERRRDIIQTIFEITGIADVLRGSSDPRETAKAQSLKAQFGTQRLQKRQKDIQRFARDLIRLKAEIIATKFTPETISMMTGMTLTPEVEAVLRNDALLSFRIDIETDSTVLEDTERQQQAMADFAGAFANFINALAPGVESGDIPKDVASDLLKAMVRNFKLGRIAEDALDRLSEPKTDEQGNPIPEQEGPSPEEIEAQGKQQELQLKQQESQAENELKQAELQLKSRELDIKEAELGLKRDEAAAKDDIERTKVGLEAKKARQEEFSDVTGLPVDTDGMEEEVKQMFEAFAQVLESQAQTNERLAQASEAQTQMLGALLQAQTAEKKVIFENGRPVGIETVQPTLQ